MADSLRVNLERLKDAADAQIDVSTFVSQMRTGQSMANAAAGMAGLLSEAACQTAGSIFDTAANTVHDELSMHSSHLATAVVRYHTTDDELGRRLGQKLK